MRTRELERRLVGLRIARLKRRRLPAEPSTSRDSAWTLDEIVLSDGTCLSFAPIEREDGYGIQMFVSPESRPAGGADDRDRDRRPRRGRGSRMMGETEIRKLLREAEADERLYYPPAIVDVNAPLALIQVELKAIAGTLRDVLGEPRIAYGPRKKAKGGSAK